MNYYLTGIEGMQKILDCCEDPMIYFKKKTYPEAFKRMYNEHFQTFDAIENGFNMVIDKDTFLSNMANALTASAVEKINACSKKRDKEGKMMDLNMTMAVFVLPMILEYKGKSSQILVDKILESWKREFPKSTLQAANYEYIEKGFHKKFCYITTAVCENFGKADDCYELKLLRDYRDNYLAEQPGGEAMIREYYDVAPTIVKHINQTEEPQQVYQAIWSTYLQPCISMIENQELEQCQELYREMVYTLKDEYFIQ